MAVRVYFPEGKDQIRVRLHKASAQMTRKTQTYMKRKAKEMESYMKSHHPWTNRTGDAERGLKAKLSVSPKMMSQTIELSHSVYYGVYLEKGFDGRFAIIQPTINIKGPSIVAETQQLWTDIMIGP